MNVDVSNQKTARWLFLAAFFLLLAQGAALCQTPAAKKGRRDLTVEAMLPQWSLEKATSYLDEYADLHETGGCLNCHATFAYLPVRPFLPQTGDKEAQRRQATEDWATRLLDREWPPEASGPDPIDQTLQRRIAEAMLSASVLAQHDAATSGTLQPLSRRALDLVWTLQREDGGWHWLKTNEPPSATDDHYGATMLAIGLGMAPGDYAQTPAAISGIEKMRAFFAANPPRHTHQKIMLLWADHSIGGLLSPEERQATVAETLALQRPDGGWAMASLADWKRIDGTPQELVQSDGYGTGLVVAILRAAGGIPTDDPRIQRAIRWIETHQRESGYWYARSPKIEDTLTTYVGTVYALMALRECQLIPQQERSARLPTETRTVEQE